jgi:formate dehydrogenase major subunit
VLHWKSTVFAVTVPDRYVGDARARASIGIDIPKLCATDSIEPFGSCRLCVVEIEGARGYAGIVHDAGCRRHGRYAEPASRDVRRGIMELYISDHPLDCLTCSANGELRTAGHGRRRGLREVRYNPHGHNHLQAVKDESNPYFTF